MFSRAGSFLILLGLPVLLTACGVTASSSSGANSVSPLRVTESTTSVSLTGLSEAAAATSVDEPYPWADDVWGAAAGFQVLDLFDADFRIAAMREEWDRTERVELVFHSREPVHGFVEALIGGYLYREERDWEEGTQSIIVDAWGFGFDLGAMIYPYEPSGTSGFDFGIHPYARFGLGFTDGDFRNIDVNLPGAPGTSSGDLGDIRFDFGVGIEARAVVGQTMFIGVGTGLHWWTTTDGSVGTTRDGGGFIIVEDDEFDFRGSEGYVSATVGFYW